MNATTLLRLIRYPGTPIRSLWLSLLHGQHKRWDLPIVASWPSRLRREASARLDIRGKLVLGWFFTQLGETGQIAYDHTLVQMARDSRLTIHGRVSLGPGVRVLIGPKAKMSIGPGTFVTSNSHIFCTNAITIGEDCAISWDVQIMDTDFHTVIVDGERRRKSAPVHIGNHVWIGTGCKVLKGVKIGDGAVIGAGTVVTRDVPAGTLVAGNPARILKHNVNWLK